MSFMTWLAGKTARPSVTQLARDLNAAEGKPLDWEINGKFITARYEVPTEEGWFVIHPAPTGGYGLTHDRIEGLQTTALGIFDSYSAAQAEAQEIADATRYSWRTGNA